MNGLFPRSKPNGDEAGRHRRRQRPTNPVARRSECELSPRDILRIAAEGSVSERTVLRWLKDPVDGVRWSSRNHIVDAAQRLGIALPARLTSTEEVNR